MGARASVGEQGNRARALGDGRSDGDRRRGLASASAATATAPPPSKAIPSASCDILRDPDAQGHRHPRHRQRPGGGAGRRSCERGSCERRDAAAAEVPAHRARVPQDPGPRPQEHRADLRALPHQHHRRAGAALPGAEAARAAAHGRQAGREGAALHRAIPPAQRPLPAELRRRRGGGADRRPAAGAGRGGHHARRQPAARTRDGGRSRPAGHRARTPPRRSNASSRTRAWRKCWARGENKASAKVGREGLQVDVRALPPRELRRRHAVLHRQQGPQRGHPHARREDGAQAQRVRPVPRGGRCQGGRRDRRRRLRGAGPALDSARAARELRRDRSRRRRAACRSWWS